MKWDSANDIVDVDRKTVIYDIAIDSKYERTNYTEQMLSLSDALFDI